MIDSLEQGIIDTLQTIFDRFGWVGVTGLMIFENATGITPSEIILSFAGWFLIQRHEVSPAFIPLAGLYAGIGSTVGASIPYWIARKGGEPLVRKFTDLLGISMERVEQVETRFREWGSGIILIGRIIPGVRTLVNIPAGLARMSFGKFLVATFVGSYVWCTLLIGAGYVLGREWRTISDMLKANLPLVILGAALLLGAYLVYHYRESLPLPGRTRQNREEKDFD
jgi:membrane protein DedA with SNARE-associated domain